MEYIINFNYPNKQNNILDIIVRNARSELEQKLKIDIKKHGLTNKCDYARSIVAKYLDKAKINYDYIETTQILSNDVTGHSFLIAYLENDSFIIDITYQQFFNKEQCKKENYQKYQDLIIKAPLPGYYYITHPNDINIAKEILENGYIKLNEKNLKTYLDSFYLTRRGRIINTDIKASTYINAIESIKRKNQHKK